MEFQQIKTMIFTFWPVRWLEAAGLLISGALYFMYLALAAGYEQSLQKNASGPGVNMFELFAVFHFIEGCCFAGLLVLGLFRKSFLRLFLRVPLLLLLALISLRIYAVSFETWPVWIEHYSKALFSFSYMDVLLFPIVVALWILTAFEWINHFGSKTTKMS